MTDNLDELFFNVHVRGCLIGDRDSNIACEAIKESYKTLIRAAHTQRIERIGDKLMSKAAGVGHVADKEIESTFLSALGRRKYAEID